MSSERRSTVWVECEECGRCFDDEFRSCNCPHKKINPGLSVDLEPPDDPRSQWNSATPWHDLLGTIFFALALLVVIWAIVSAFHRRL